MKQPIRLLLILSASALFATACSTVPTDDTTMDPAYTGSTSIPEAGPLTAGGGNYTAAAPSYNNYQPEAVAPANPAPVVDNQYAYAQPEAAPYDNYTAGNAGNNAGGAAYDPQYADPQPANGGYDYAASNGAPTGGSYDYSAPGGDVTYGGNNSYNDPYAAGANNNTTYAANNYAPASGGATGGAAVQVFASGSSSKAEQIRQSMASRGLQAVVDPVAGLYKVRVPFGSENEARANLARVRSVSGESGAFVTFR